MKRRSSGQERRIRIGRVLGLAFIAGGFVAIVLGWAGAARQACVDCQLPYLLSGGAAGVALVVFGVGLLLLVQIRTEGMRLALEGGWGAEHRAHQDPVGVAGPEDPKNGLS